MKGLFVFIISQLFYLTAIAQEFNVLVIPDSLKKGADVVKRYEEFVLEIKSPGSAKIYERHVYTLLNSNASGFARYKTYYDKFTRINSASGVLYDALGREIKHLKKKDWQDMSVYDGISLANDDRVKVNEFFYSEYPFTVDYEEEDEKDGVMYLSDWFPVSNFRMSVQYSKYTIIAPADYVVRYKQMNISSPPTVTQKGDKKIYTWEVKNIPAYKYENASPGLTEIVPNIQFAPSEMEVEGYKGNMTTWESFGKFIYQLMNGKDQLPADVKQKVHALTDQLKSDKEKAFALYDFLQKNTHYISIQLGIGGWRPFDAKYVAEKKYGDCKALSNYMVALLKEAGVKANYVLINAGKTAAPLMEDFSCSQFNHAVSCLPMGKDTLWFECTSQSESPGFMGSFTGNRKAVLIDENGGYVVNTPRYTEKENQQIRTTDASLSGDGMLDAVIKTVYKGVEQELPQALVDEATNEEREKFLNERFKLPTYKIISSNYSLHKNILPVVDESLQIQVNNYASITGRRLFIAPNIYGGETEKLLPDTSRKYDYIIKHSFTHIDTIIIKVPVGYKPESMPRDITIDTKFGKFSASYKVESDKIFFYRKKIQYSMRIPASEYNELVKYSEQIYKADKSRIVLVKQE